MSYPFLELDHAHQAALDSLSYLEDQVVLVLEDVPEPHWPELRRFGEEVSYLRKRLDVLMSAKITEMIAQERAVYDEMADRADGMSY